ncbi:unnamed protein product [Prunus armeniaca]
MDYSNECNCQLLSHVLTRQHGNSEGWASDIPRGMGYTSNQPHMGDKAAWEPNGQLREMCTHSKGVTPFSLKFTSAIL